MCPLLAQQAASLGLSLESLPTVPSDLTHLPWATRVLVYRDSVMLAYADSDESSLQESKHLDELATRLGLPRRTIEEVRAWISDYSALLQRLDGLTTAPAEG